MTTRHVDIEHLEPIILRYFRTVNTHSRLIYLLRKNTWWSLWAALHIKLPNRYLDRTYSLGVLLLHHPVTTSLTLHLVGRRYNITNLAYRILLSISIDDCLVGGNGDGKGATLRVVVSQRGNTIRSCLVRNTPDWCFQHSHFSTATVQFQVCYVYHFRLLFQLLWEPVKLSIYNFRQ